MTSLKCEEQVSLFNSFLISFFLWLLVFVCSVQIGMFQLVLSSGSSENILDICE